MLHARFVRLGLACVLTASLVLAGCGDEPAPIPSEELLATLEIAEGEALEHAAEAVGVRAQTDEALMEKLVAMLRLDEPNAGRFTLHVRLAAPDALADDDARRVALTAAMRVMAERLPVFRQPPGTFDLRSSQGNIEILIPKPVYAADVSQEERVRLDHEHAAALIRQLTASGNYELLLTVPPPSEDLTPPSLWTGSRKAFDRLVEEQGTLIDAAVKAGAIYAPAEPGFVVCAVPPKAGEAAHGFLVVHRSPSSAARFGRGDFTLRGIQFLESGEQGLELSVVPARRAAMKAWSAANLGRTAVLVINGVAGVPLLLAKPIDGKVVIRYGPRGDALAASRIRAVERFASLLPHPVPVVATRVTAVAPETMSPAALALVASGTAGAKRMSELRRERGVIGARAARILELIGRRRTTGGERYVPGAN